MRLLLHGSIETYTFLRSLKLVNANQASSNSALDFGFNIILRASPKAKGGGPESEVETI